MLVPWGSSQCVDPRATYTFKRKQIWALNCSKLRHVKTKKMQKSSLQVNHPGKLCHHTSKLSTLSRDKIFRAPHSGLFTAHDHAEARWKLPDCLQPAERLSRPFPTRITAWSSHHVPRAKSFCMRRSAHLAGSQSHAVTQTMPSLKDETPLSPQISFCLFF